MTRLKVEGMSCGHCVKAVKEALEQVPGVQKVVEVSLERGEALVEGNPDVQAMIQAVEEEGYKAQAA